MKALILLATAASIVLVASAYAEPGRGGEGDGGWRNGERNGTTKNRDWPGETNGFVRQDYRAYLNSDDPTDDTFDNLANSLEGYATRDAYRGVAGKSGNVPGARSQRENGLPQDLQF